MCYHITSIEHWMVPLFLIFYFRRECVEKPSQLDTKDDPPMELSDWFGSILSSNKKCIICIQGKQQINLALSRSKWLYCSLYWRQWGTHILRWWNLWPWTLRKPFWVEKISFQLSSLDGHRGRSNSETILYTVMASHSKDDFKRNNQTGCDILVY